MIVSSSIKRTLARAHIWRNVQERGNSSSRKRWSLYEQRLMKKTLTNATGTYVCREAAELWMVSRVGSSWKALSAEVGVVCSGHSAYRNAYRFNNKRCVFANYLTETFPFITNFIINKINILMLNKNDLLVRNICTAFLTEQIQHWQKFTPWYRKIYG